jgi:Fe2+ transport system protein B
MSTIAVTIRETNSYAWGLWQFAGFSMIAYALSFLIYQTGILMNLS